MKTYMLAQFQLRYGMANVNRYQEAMVLVKELFESEGVRRRQGMITRVGRLYEAWNLWEIEEHGHVSRAMAKLATTPKAVQAMEMLAEVVEHEDVHYLDSLPFSAEN